MKQVCNVGSNPAGGTQKHLKALENINKQGDFMSLIVRSKVKKAAKGVRISGDFYDALDRKVEEVIKQASVRAKGNKRATLRAVDL
jgi:histone H3/H4